MRKNLLSGSVGYIYSHFTQLDGSDGAYVVDSFVEYIKIDREKILLLQDMVGAFSLDGNEVCIEDVFSRIQKINVNSMKIFRQISKQIMSEKLQVQKQHVFLCLHRGMYTVSSSILKLARYLFFLKKNKSEVHLEIINCMKKILINIEKIHQFVLNGVLSCSSSQDKDAIFLCIHEISCFGDDIDEEYLKAIDLLYRQLEDDTLYKIGSMRSVERVLSTLTTLTKDVIDVFLSLECLLVLY